MNIHRGAILLECLLALALFVAGGVSILAMIDGSIVRMERVRDLRHAADLARSAMARIETGESSAEALQGRVLADGEEADAGTTPAGEAAWELEVETSPAAFPGLTRVTVRAMKRTAADEIAASFELVQLVKSSADAAEAPYARKSP